jgi:hypothetical protein
MLELWEERTKEEILLVSKIKIRRWKIGGNREANVTSDVLQYALILSLDNIVDSLVVDSGVPFHVQGDFGQVYLSDDKPYKLVGKGKI